jgi:hypothetical protein
MTRTRSVVAVLAQSLLASLSEKGSEAKSGLDSGTEPLDLVELGDPINSSFKKRKEQQTKQDDTQTTDMKPVSKDSARVRRRM